MKVTFSGENEKFDNRIGYGHTSFEDESEDAYQLEQHMHVQSDDDH